MIALADSRVAGLLLNTLTLVAWTAAVALPIGGLLAVIVFRTAFAGRRALLAMLIAQSFVPLVLQAGAWQAGFGLTGWWTLHQTELTSPPTCVWLDGWRGAVWVHALAAIPMATLIIGVGLLQVDSELEERILLTSPLSGVLRRVTLPRMVCWLAVALLWIAITVGGEMTVTDYFQVRTYAEELYTEATIGSLDELPLSAWPLVVAALGVATIGVVAIGRWMPIRREVDPRPPLRFSLGSAKLLAFVFVALVVLVVIVLPLGSLLWKAGVLVTSTEAGRVRSWSLMKCFATIFSSPWRYRQELGWSLAVGALAASASTAIAWTLAWRLRQTGKGCWLAWGAMSALAALPGPVVGLSLIRILNQPELPWLTWLYDRTLLAPWLAQTIRTLPWAWLIAWTALRTIPEEVVDRLRLTGIGSLSALRWIVVPGQLRSVAAGWCVAMLLAFGDVAGSILVLPPGITTLAVRLFGLLHYGVEDDVAGVCLMLALGMLVLSGLVGRTFDRLLVPNRG